MKTFRKKRHNKRKTKRQNKTKIKFRAGSSEPRKSLKEIMEMKKRQKLQATGQIVDAPPPTPTPPPQPIKPSNKTRLTEFKNSQVNQELNLPVGEKKVALMFIIIDDLPLENLWRDWLEDFNGKYYNNIEIFIHAKFPERIRSRWVGERLIRSNLRPNWGSIELSKAMYYLMDDAFNVRGFSADYFVFLSESCIPIYRIDKFFEIVNEQTKSWIDFNDKPTNGYAYSNQFMPLKLELPDECVLKSDQWVMLNRPNVEQLLNFEKQTNISIWNIMSNVAKASDEMWIASSLCILNNGLEGKVEKRKVTYVDWGQETRSPLTFDEITPDLIAKARENGSLFMRKFASRNPNWLINDWHKVVGK